MIPRRERNEMTWIKFQVWATNAQLNLGVMYVADIMMLAAWMRHTHGTCTLDATAAAVGEERKM